MELKEKLAILREERSMSQGELAGKVGVSRQTVSKWEQGRIVPSAKNLIALGRLYGVPLDELANGVPESEEESTEGPPITVAAEEPETPQEPGRRRMRAVVGAALAACLLLAAIASVITIWTAVFKEPDKPENGIVWTDDIEPDYIDPAEVIDCTEGRMIIP